jgi:uncharacterized protein GlcG (DUF336 family)
MKSERDGINPAAEPSGTGCVECLAFGGWWFHLRRCAECGHIGCCDSSPNQHASKHYAAAGHPIITSFEPGERWVCDNQGHLIAFNRIDRAYAEGDRFAIGKAVASAGTGLPSGEIESRVDHPPAADVVAQGVPALHVRGGLLIFRSGQIEGGCGVDGAPSHHEQEEACARAGIASLGP